MASSSAIKGLTIEIGANTTKFTTALNSLEKDARNISKDLKTVNENLKLDPSSAEKSADKLKLLQDAAQKASEKVDLIKQAIKKLNEQESDKSTDRYKNALAELEQQLASAEREQSLANERVKAFGTASEEAGQKAVSLGDIIKGNLIASGISKGLSAVAGFFKDIAEKAFEAAKAVATFAKNYANEAVELAAAYEDAIGYSEQVYGDLAEESQKWVTDNSVRLRIYKGDLQSYVNSFGAIFNGFGYGKDQALGMSEQLIQLAADLRAATGKDIDSVIQSLTSGFTSSTKALQQFGVVTNEAAIKAKALELGLVNIEVNDLAVEKATLKVTEANKKATEALAKYGENSLEYQKASLAVTEAENAFQDALGGTVLELDRTQRTSALLSIVLEDLSFLYGQSDKEADNYNSKLDTMNTVMQNLKETIGEKLLPVYSEFVGKVIEFLQSDAGKAVMDALAESVGLLAEKVMELLKDERLVQWVQDLKDRIPELTQQFIDFTGKVADLIPKIVDLTEKALEFFGVGDGAEAARARESFLRTKDAVQTFATESGISLEQATQAVEAFARESGTSSKNIYDNWSEYEPLIAEWYRRLADDANGTATDFDTAMDKLPESATAGLEGVSAAITNYTESDELRAKVRGWADGIINAAKGAWDFIKNIGNEVDEPHSTGGGSGYSSGATWTPRAKGGYAYANRPYLVGDDAQNRPEIYIPNTDGRFLNGDQTERILNNISNNNSRNFSGGINIYVNSYGMNVAEVADELGAAFNNRIRMSGATL